MSSRTNELRCMHRFMLAYCLIKLDLLCDLLWYHYKLLYGYNKRFWNCESRLILNRDRYTNLYRYVLLSIITHGLQGPKIILLVNDPLVITLLYLLLNTWCNNNVVITSKRRHFDVTTPKWRRFDVITMSLRNVIPGLPVPRMGTSSLYPSQSDFSDEEWFQPWNTFRVLIWSK